MVRLMNGLDSQFESELRLSHRTVIVAVAALGVVLAFVASNLPLPEDRFRQDQVGYLYSAATGRLDRYLGTLGFDTFLDEIAAFSLNYRDSFYNLLAVPVADVQRIKFIEVALTLQEEDFQITLRNLVVLDNPVNVP